MELIHGHDGHVWSVDRYNNGCEHASDVVDRRALQRYFHIYPLDPSGNLT